MSQQKTEKNKQRTTHQPLQFLEKGKIDGYRIHIFVCSICSQTDAFKVNIHTHTPFATESNMYSIWKVTKWIAYVLVFLQFPLNTNRLKINAIFLSVGKTAVTWTACRIVIFLFLLSTVHTRSSWYVRNTVHTHFRSTVDVISMVFRQPEIEPWGEPKQK